MGAEIFFKMTLLDGKPSGAIQCTKGNHGLLQIYKVPRSDLIRHRQLSALKQSGIYFLFGINHLGEPSVYIGQASVRKNEEGLLLRVNEHHRKNDFAFVDAVMMTTALDSLGRTELSYLELFFYLAAKKAKRFNLWNRVEPAGTNILKSDEIEMQGLIRDIKMALELLGYPLCRPKTMEASTPSLSKLPPEESEEVRLYYRQYNKREQRYLEAACVLKDGLFILKKESR